MDFRAPEHFRAIFRETLQDAFFSPDPIALWAEPAGPVISTRNWLAKGETDEDKQGDFHDLIGAL